jgi:hypothetical protein
MSGTLFQNIGDWGNALGQAVGGFAGNVTNPLLGGEQTTQTTTKTSTKEDNSTTWIVGITVAIVLVVGGIIIYKLSKSSS